MNSRILYLDGLRGILAIIVFLHHFLYLFYPELIFGGNYDTFIKQGPFSIYRIIGLTPLNILFNPGFAIHFFFLLSGYVQTQAYFRKPTVSFLQKSLLKRYFRLAFPTVSVVVLVFLFHKLHFVHKELIPLNTLNSQWVKGLMPNNLNFLQVLREGLSDCFRGNSRYYQILWTMSTELINSFVVLGLLLLFHNLRHQMRVFVFIILVQFVILGEYYSMAFVCGTLFANLEVNSEKSRSVFNTRPIKYLCLFGGLYFGSYPFTGYQNAAVNSVYAPISFFDTYPHVISYLIGVLLLFCFLLHSKASQQLLTKRIVLFFGQISFMFYLIHFLLLLSFTPWLYQHLSAEHGVNFTFSVSLVTSFMLTTGVAFLLTKFIDAPVIKACNFYVKKFF